MVKTRILLLTTLTMCAFASNSLLCRLALRSTPIDPASFTAVRLVSGAAVLWLLVQWRGGLGRGGNWPSAWALFAYAACLSFSYGSLSTATGALLLFGAVQLTMISYGVWSGERMKCLQWLGLALALAGVVFLMLPGVSSAPIQGALLMVGSGVAWGIYSLRGKGSGDPIQATAGNFLRAAPLAMGLVLGLSAWAHPDLVWDDAGVLYAIASGALASGIGYAIWYTVLPALKATTAASVQLSVPVLAAFGGVWIGEALTLRLVVASVVILGGIALVISERQSATVAGD